MLEQTYRCTKRVSDVLDLMIKYNRHILSGKVDKAEALSMPPFEGVTEGEFHQLLPGEVQENTWLLARARGVHLAVVTQAAYVTEARRVFNTALVFTPEQIQGQEFHTVVVYKLLLDEASRTIIRKASEALLRPWAHKIITACTRAKYSLVIVDERNTYWDRLIPTNGPFASHGTRT